MSLLNYTTQISAENRKITPRLRTMEQASRVAWRIIKDWLAAQLALIKAEMVTLEQVFLPYAQNADGATLFDVLAEGKFRGLALPSSNPNPARERGSE